MSVSEFGGSTKSDRLSWGRGLKRQSKRASQDAKCTTIIRSSDFKKDGVRSRSHTEGSQFTLPNSGDIFLYSSHNLEASSQPKLIHQRRKSDGPLRTTSTERSHRIGRSQSSQALSHAFFEPRPSRHQHKSSINSLSLVKDEDEDLLPPASIKSGIPSSPLRESQTLEWDADDHLPPSWRKFEDQTSTDRSAIMAASSKALRRRSGEFVNVAALKAAQATKRGMKVIRRAGSFEHNRSRSNSSSSLLSSLRLYSGLDTHRRSHTFHLVDSSSSREVGEKGKSASVPKSPKLQGLGLHDLGRSNRFSQITEAEDETSLSKDLPQVETTPESEGSEQGSNSSDPPARHALDEPRVEPPVPQVPAGRAAKSESERRHGLGKRSFAALIDMLNPAVHKDSRSRQGSTSGSGGPIGVVAHGDNHGGRSNSSSGTGASGGASNNNTSRARGNSSSARTNNSASGGSGGGAPSGSGSGGGGPPDRRNPPPSRNIPPSTTSDLSTSVTSIYRRLELVGRGAYGAVYRGIHLSTGSSVALKVVNLDTPDDDVSDIQREVSLLSQLREASSRNVVRYWGCWLKGPELWIVMDFAEGGSVRTLMKAGPISERYCSIIVRETLVALNYLHKSEIIHRDIKAANILLTREGRILLCDFGVAASLPLHSKRSTFVGTPYWMAPEVITEGKSYDTKADVWSLGITIYEMATGNPPLAEVEQMRVIMLIPKSKPPRLPEGDFSQAMRDFVAACLNEEPKERASSEELTKLKWIKASQKMGTGVLKELIEGYNKWTKAGGMRMSLIAAEGEGWEKRDSFSLEGKEMGDGWEFDTVRGSQAYDDEIDDQEPIQLRDHPLLRLFDVEPNDGAPVSNAVYAPRGGAGGDAGTRKQPNAPTASVTATTGGTVKAEPAKPLTAQRPALTAGVEKASFTGTGQTPFRFGVAAPSAPSPSPSPLAPVTNITRKRSQSLSKPPSFPSSGTIVIPDSRSLHDLAPSRMVRAETSGGPTTAVQNHHRQSHGGSDPTTSGSSNNPAYSRLARLRAGYVRRDSGSLGSLTASDNDAPQTPTGGKAGPQTTFGVLPTVGVVGGLPSVAAEKGVGALGGVGRAVLLEGPPLRPLDFGNLKTKEEVSASLGRTVDELGKWLDVLSLGLGRAVHSEL